jgi:branched-chain amino acid aminotransferase
MCGTAAEVTPVREVDSRKIGTGEPGPVTRKIQAVFFDAVKGERTPYPDWLTYL